MGLNEADTCRVYVTPALQRAEWRSRSGQSQSSTTSTDGQVVLVGDGHRRAKGKKADYLLRYEESFPIAVVEAKDEDHEKPAAGLQQAKEYAQILGLLFAYSTNGRRIEEWDFTINTQRSLSAYPSPDELWQRRAFKAIDAARPRNPLLTPYCAKGDKLPRYYQEVAINNTIEAMLQGRNRILINLATGTGKTVIAFQPGLEAVALALERRRRRPTPASPLPGRPQYTPGPGLDNTFEPFGNERDMIAEGKAPTNRSIYFGIYQAMYSGVDGKRLYQRYPRDFFDLIVIDECHRSGFGTWNAILKHFDGAVQLGMTATPKRTENIDSYKYFGEPVFTYSLGQGIDDGFLATYKVHRA